MELETGLKEAAQFLRQPGALAEHDRYTAGIQTRAGAARLGCATVFAAIAAVLVPVLLMWRSTLPAYVGARGPVLIFAIGLCAGAVVLIGKALRDLAVCRAVPTARSAWEACELFYQAAMESPSEPTMTGRDDRLRSVGGLFPKPLLRDYVRRLSAIAAAWDGCLKTIGPVGEFVSVGVQETPVGDGSIELVVEVTLSGERTVTFRNAAVAASGRWFLIVMGPELSP